MSSYVESTTASSGIGSALSPGNVREAQNFASESAAEFRQNLNEGHMSLRLLALLGGVAMIVVSVMGFMSDAFMLKWISAVFQIYTVVLGFVIIILESGRRLSFFRRLENTLYKNALFLKYVWGRGLLYFFAGTLMISLSDPLDVLVGLYFCAVGILFWCVGRSAAKKMGNLRRSAITPQQLQEQFAAADKDGKGSLTMKQFRSLTNGLGMDLTRREVESTFSQFDCGPAGRVNYETILHWWNNDAVETDDFQLV